MTDTGIIEDRNFWDCGMLDTQNHIANSLGAPIAEIACAHLMDEKAQTAFIEAVISAYRAGIGDDEKTTEHGGSCYTGNMENNLDRDFSFRIFAEENSDPYWSQAFVAIDDGGLIRMFQVDSLGDTGFLDFTLQWEVLNSWSDRVDCSDEFQNGYSANPTCHLDSRLKDGLTWSDKHGCYVGWMESNILGETHANAVKAWPRPPYYGT
jgi:hypothetical protein